MTGGLSATPSIDMRMTRRVRPPNAAGSPFLWLSAILIAIMAIEAAEGGWVADFWLHTAVVNELARSPFHPANPLVVGPYPDFYFSPYLLLLALIVRVTGLPTAAVLAAAGIANLGILLVAFRLLVGCFTGKSQAAAIGLVVVLLAWGIRTWEWSGFLNLAGLPLILPYPSTFATALMLLSWVLLIRTIRRPNALGFAGLALTGAIIGLTNPYALLNGMLGYAAILIAEYRSWSGRLMGGLALAALACGAMALAWPYFPILDALKSSPAAAAIHRPLYSGILEGAGLASVGLPAIWWRWRRQRTDWLVWLFIFAALLLALGWVLRDYQFGRVWPVVVLPLQLAAALEVADPPSGRNRWLTIGFGVLVAIAVIVGLRGGAGGLVRAIPASYMSPALRAQLYIVPPTSFPVVARCLRSNDVVATDNLIAERALPGYGAKVVAPGYPSPLIPDEAQRHADENALFTKSTTREMVESILARYHVRWVLWDPARPLAAPSVYRVVATEARGLKLLAAPGNPIPAHGC